MIDATELAEVAAGVRCGFIPVRSWNVDGNSLWASNCDFYGQDLPNRQYTTNNIQECSKKCSDDPQYAAISPGIAVLPLFVGNSTC
jgi:hypothetical protein